jgi:hypothetical protein
MSTWPFPLEHASVGFERMLAAEDLGALRRLLGRVVMTGSAGVTARSLLVGALVGVAAQPLVGRLAGIEQGHLGGRNLVPVDACGPVASEAQPAAIADIPAININLFILSPIALCDCATTLAQKVGAGRTAGQHTSRYDPMGIRWHSGNCFREQNN